MRLTHWGTMTFASWFELIPRLKNFRPLMCAGPNLTIEEGLKGCAWRLTVGLSVFHELGKISVLSRAGAESIQQLFSQFFLATLVQ